MSFFKQLRLLLWKNCLNQKRQIVWTFFELFIPLTFTAIFVGMRQTVDSKIIPITVYKPYHVTGTWLDFWQRVDNSSMVNHVLGFKHNDNYNNSNYCLQFDPRIVFYAPSTKLTEAIMNIVGMRTGLDVQGFPNETSMVDQLVTLFNQVSKCNNTYLGGIYFDTNSFGVDKFANNSLVYTIRLSNTNRNPSKKNKTQQTSMLNVNKGWNTNLDYPVVPTLGPREPYNADGGKPGYWREGFLTLQKAVDAAIVTVMENGLDWNNWPISHCQLNDIDKLHLLEYLYCKNHDSNFLKSYNLSHSLNCSQVELHLPPQCTDWMKNDTQLSSVLLERFPYPSFLDNPYIAVIQQNLPMLLMLSYVISALYIVRYVTIEKEKRLKEYMRVMGLSNFVQWVSYFIINMLKLLVSVVFMSIMLTVSINGKRVMDKSDWSVVFVFLFAYSICTVCYCFAISVFFKKGNTAAAFGGIIWFVLYVPYFFLQPRYAYLTRPMKLASSLLFSTAMSFGAQIIGSFEGEGTGIQWSNINQPATVNDNFTMVDVILMMLLDSVICLLITWYVEAVHPGDEGVPQPFYFPFMLSYWLPNTKLVRQAQPFDFNENIDETIASKVEPYEQGLVPQIVINRLTKIFGRRSKRKTAVNDLSLKMYPGQTTVLLGHNGAGKSTTMAMITGMLAPSSGTATLNGFDIRNGLVSARKYLGLCPQYNPLFDNLTVMEHVKFFCQLKGRYLLMSEVHRLFKSLGLTPKENCLAKTLSGGMKRKLCLAIALVGGSEIVMLDEPTSGMDPSARHEAWHLLQHEKQNRTILLTTHYMEEADLLGDRIAILSHGKLQCFGSSLFLKRIYGAGYHLTVIFDKLDGDTHDIKERAGWVLDMIREQVPDAQIESAIGAEASFLLPNEYRDKYQTLFFNLEASQQNLAVISFGVSVTTMEEVFLRVAKEADDRHFNRIENEPQLIPSIRDMSFGSQKTVDGFHLLSQQFGALLIKRALHSLRNWLVLLVQLVIPVALLIAAILINKMLPGPVEEPALALNLDRFGQTYIGFFNGSNDSLTYNISNRYEQSFDNSPKYVITDMPSGNIVDYVIRGTQEFPDDTFDLTHIIGAAFETLTFGKIQIPQLVAYFNNQPYHGPGITLNAVDNAILSEATNGTYQITTINHPLPPTNLDQLSDWIATGVIEFNIAMFLMFGMAFLASSFVVLLIKERITKAKHLQLLGGLPSSIFWLSSFIWDYMNYMLTVAALLIVFCAFDINPLIGGSRWLHILLIFVLYGWAILPMMYCFSFCFSSPASGFVMMTIFNILSGMATFCITAVFLALQLDSIYNILHYIFMVFSPTFCLGQTIDLYYMNFFIEDTCKQYMSYCDIYGHYLNISPCCTPNIFTTHPLEWTHPGIGQWLLCMCLQGVCCFLLLAFIECGYGRSLSYWLKRMFRKSRTPLPPLLSTIALPELDVDVDVEEENEKAAKATGGDVPVVARDLTKYYGTFLAVNKVNFVVRSGECFGLLGVNGAGKTTTFQMLTGENSLTAGDAFIVGNSIKHDWRQAGKMVGYCPQFDALIDQLTGREHLVMFARLKGIPEKEIGQIVRNVLSAVGVNEYADKQVKTYSGGNKRKLSLGVGLIGAPKVLLLDEPTSGVDPASRRIIWNVLAQVRAQGVAVVLTSHSMEECEALCTRLAIMVDGKFKCLGSSQHLKTKRGKGYTLLIKIGDTNYIETALKVIKKTFPGILLKETHHCQLHYEIPVSEHQSWSSLFGTLERLVEPLHIVDYSLSQITLEQIFLSLLAEKNSNFAALDKHLSFTSNSFNQIE